MSISGGSVSAAVIVSDSVTPVVASLKAIFSTACRVSNERHVTNVELYAGSGVIYLVESSHLLVQCLEILSEVSRHLNTSVAGASFDSGTEIRRLFVVESGKVKCCLAGSPSDQSPIIHGDVSVDDQRQFFEEPGLVGVNALLTQYKMDLAPLFSDSRDEMETDTIICDIDVVETYISDALNRQFGFVKANARGFRE